MRFSSIEIVNYRQYQSLELVFKRGPHDLQVIIGDNGTGKTNLLNAFTWCLYGKEPHLGIEDKAKGEPKLNKEALLSLIENGESLSFVRVTVEIEHGDELVRIMRKLPVRVVGITEVFEKKAEETFVVTRIKPDGSSIIVPSDMATAFLNRLLPESIREYFFFDGEQLSNYFSETRADAIRSAVHSISQINDVTRMKERVNAVVKSLRSEASKAAPNLQAYDEKINKHEGLAKSYGEKAEKAEAEARTLKEKVEELNEQLRGIPDVEALELRRNQLRKKIKEEQDNLSQVRERYIRFARERYVDFSFYEIAEQAYNAILAMEKNNQLPPAIDHALLESMLSAHMCEICRRPLSEDEEGHIRALLEQFRVSSETSNILTGMRSELHRLIARVRGYKKDRDSLVQQLKKAQSDFDNVSEELESIERSIEDCPNAPQVKLMAQERSQYEEKIEMLIKDAGDYAGKRKMAENVVGKTQAEYNKAMLKAGVLLDVKNAATFGGKAFDILSSVEEAVIDETRLSMARETEDLFKGLVWKDSKCDHVELSRHYQLSLYDKAGFSCAGTCSAAERALLALSFTLAMHSVSGFESPLFIDTPIARASGDNRANFAETLAEVSKDKQLILTFTPDEYSEAIAAVFDPIAASYLHLTMDENERVVTVRGE